MKVSVIVDDKTVVVDGVGLVIPTDRWPSTPSNVWAHQWDGSAGETESNVKGTPHVEFTDIATVQPYIDIHTTIINEIAAAKAAAEAEAAEASE
jgi:hypothetical protein